MTPSTERKVKSVEVKKSFNFFFFPRLFIKGFKAIAATIEIKTCHIYTVMDHSKYLTCYDLLSSLDLTVSS